MDLNLRIVTRQMLKEIRTIGSAIKFLGDKLDELFQVLVAVPVPEDQLINVHRAAEILDVSTKSVERYRQRGLLSFSKPAGLVYYSRNEVTELAKNINSGKKK